MSKFITVAKAHEIPQGQGRRFSVEGRQIAVFYVQGQYHALDDRCPHMGVSLAEGKVHDRTVVCIGHSWAFNLGDGRCKEVPDLEGETFEVRRQGDEIQVRVPE